MDRPDAIKGSGNLTGHSRTLSRSLKRTSLRRTRTLFSKVLTLLPASHWQVFWVQFAKYLRLLIELEWPTNPRVRRCAFDGVDHSFQTSISTENQFITYRASVKPLLRPGANDLLITFASAFKKVTHYFHSTRPLLYKVLGKGTWEGQWQIPLMERWFQSPARAQGAIQVILATLLSEKFWWNY